MSIEEILLDFHFKAKHETVVNSQTPTKARKKVVDEYAQKIREYFQSREKEIEEYRTLLFEVYDLLLNGSGAESVRMIENSELMKKSNHLTKDK